MTKRILLLLIVTTIHFGCSGGGGGEGQPSDPIGDVSGLWSGPISTTFGGGGTVHLRIINDPTRQSNAFGGYYIVDFDNDAFDTGGAFIGEVINNVLSGDLIPFENGCEASFSATRTGEVLNGNFNVAQNCSVNDSGTFSIVPLTDQAIVDLTGSWSGTYEQTAGDVLFAGSWNPDITYNPSRDEYHIPYTIETGNGGVTFGDPFYATQVGERVFMYRNDVECLQYSVAILSSSLTGTTTNRICRVDKIAEFSLTKN